MAGDVRKRTHRVAKVALASAFGGPLAGLSEAGTQVVDSFLGQGADRPVGSMAELVRRIGLSLEEFARSEHLGREALERALDNACDVLARHSLSATELVAHDLDVSTVSRELQRRARPLLRTLDEVDRNLCSRILDSTVAAMLHEPALLPDLERQFQTAVLTRLTGLARRGEALGPGAVRLAAFAMVGDVSWPWVKEQYPPSALLRANYGVVPFSGREDSLDHLAGWLAEDGRVSVTVMTGAGGMGKTRLMLQACRRARAAGWRAGFLHSSVAVVATEHLDALTEDAAGALVVVDYAETRQPAVTSLIEAALDSSACLRVVLLARSLGDWWVNLKYQRGRVGDLLSGPRAVAVKLGAASVDGESRRRSHAAAAAAYAVALGLPHPVDLAVPDLGSGLYERILFVHLHALSEVLGEPADRQRELLDFALRREQAFLDDAVLTAGIPELSGRPIRQAAALTTLAGGADSFDAAVSLLTHVPLLLGQPRVTLARVAVLLHDLYPADAWVAGVQPDLLGEHLVSRSLDEDPLLLGALHGAQ